MDMVAFARETGPASKRSGKFFSYNPTTAGFGCRVNCSAHTGAGKFFKRSLVLLPRILPQGADRMPFLKFKRHVFSAEHLEGVAILDTYCLANRRNLNLPFLFGTVRLFVGNKD
jgi:hypothetical protein